MYNILHSVFILLFCFEENIWSQISWLSLIWKAEVAPLRRGSEGKGKSKSIQIEWHFLFNHFLLVPPFYLPFWNDKYHNWLVCKIMRLQFPWVMKEVSFPASKLVTSLHFLKDQSTLRNNLSNIALKIEINFWRWK